MKTKEDFDIDDELADAAITTVGLTRVDLPTFFLRLYQWMEKIEKDNAQVIEYGNKFGWLHWECITDLNNRHYYLSEVTGILKTLQELVNGYGKIKFTVPDVFDMSDYAGELNERIGRLVYKQIDEDQFCIDLLDSESRFIECEYKPFVYILKQIKWYFNRLEQELTATHRDRTEIGASANIINRIRYTCYLCYRILPNKNSIKHYEPHTFLAPSEVME